MDSLDRKRKKAAEKSFKQKLIHRFRMQVIDEDELREVSSVRFSKLGVTLSVVMLVLVIAVLSVMLYRHSPFYMQEVEKDYLLRQQMVDDMLRLDSLEDVLSIQQSYIKNMQDVFLGRKSADSVPSLDTLVANGSHILDEHSDVEDAFVEEFEEKEKYNVTSATMVSVLQSRNLFRPTTGMVSEPYDTQKRHYGVDIAANPNESVVSVTDGTVLMSNYTAEDGYMICVYHTGDMISVYKYCSSLLKKEGDRVKAGDVIALVGTVNSTYSSSHLHFELWYEGQPLDPQKYIVF